MTGTTETMPEVLPTECGHYIMLLCLFSFTAKWHRSTVSAVVLSRCLKKLAAEICHYFVIFISLSCSLEPTVSVEFHPKQGDGSHDQVA